MLYIQRSRRPTMMAVQSPRSVSPAIDTLRLGVRSSAAARNPPSTASKQKAAAAQYRTASAVIVDHPKLAQYVRKTSPKSPNTTRIGREPCPTIEIMGGVARGSPYRARLRAYHQPATISHPRTT